jgi:hypothetical protein
LSKSTSRPALVGESGDGTELVEEEASAAVVGLLITGVVVEGATAEVGDSAGVDVDDD